MTTQMAKPTMAMAVSRTLMANMMVNISTPPLTVRFLALQHSAVLLNSLLTMFIQDMCTLTLRLRITSRPMI
jgi:hypothetical protein